MTLPLPWNFYNQELEGEKVQDSFDALAAGIPNPTPVGTSLPPDPQNGQEYYYVADATNGVVWHLKYRASSSSSYKWEFVGGSELSSERAAGEWDVTTATSYQATGTAGAGMSSGSTSRVRVTLPVAGDYIFEFGANMGQGATGQSGLMTVKLGTAAASDNDALNHFWKPATVTGSNPSIGMSRKVRRNNIAANSLVETYQRVTGGSMTIANQFLHVRPIRVG